MSEKSIDTVSSEAQEVQNKLRAIEKEQNEMADKINKLELEIEPLIVRRQELKDIQKNAAKLLINGKMTDEQFDAIKDELDLLDKNIGNAEYRMEIYKKAIDNEYPKRFGELQLKLSNLKDMLMVMYSKKLADNIVKEQGETLRELAAVLSYSKRNLLDFNSFVSIGNAISLALFGGSNGLPSEQKLDEKNSLFNSVFERMGL